MKRTYGNTKGEAGSMRVVQICQYNKRGQIEIFSTLKAENFSDALTKFKEGYLVPKGYGNFLRTGNVISATLPGPVDIEDWFARDKPALI